MRAPLRRPRYLSAAWLLVGSILAGCAGPRDHFYTLAALPEGAPAPASGYTTHVMLAVSLPSVVARPQMVIAPPSNQLLVLDHERWPAPLSDLVLQTLGRDLEQRRGD